jgi:hypothetical protein
MAKAFKVKTTKTIGSVPIGYEIQVISNQSSKPLESEIRKALMDAGFKNLNGTSISESSYTVS